MNPVTDNQEPIPKIVTPDGIKLQTRHYFSKAVFIVLIISGAIGIYRSVNAVFFVYPNLPEYFRQIHYTQTTYLKLLQKAILLSTTGFAESAFGVTMLFKPANLIKNIHIVAGIALILFSLYLKTQGALIDLDVIKKATDALTTIWNVHFPKTIGCRTGSKERLSSKEEKSPIVDSASKYLGTNLDSQSKIYRALTA